MYVVCSVIKGEWHGISGITCSCFHPLPKQNITKYGRKGLGLGFGAVAVRLTVTV